jgi:hypothetical protein
MRFVKYLVKKPDFCPVGSGSNAGCVSYKTLMPSPVMNRGSSPMELSQSALTVMGGVSNKTAEAIMMALSAEYRGSIFSAIKSLDREEFSKILGEVKIGGKRIAEKTRNNLLEWLYPGELYSPKME